MDAVSTGTGLGPLLRDALNELAGYDWKILLPLGAIALILLYLILALIERIGKTRGQRILLPLVFSARGVLLALLFTMSVLAVCNYTNFFRFRYDSYLNAYEFYHYYLGSKYAGELGYTDLYNASVVADAEAGRKYGRTTEIRNLDVGNYWNVHEVLQDSEQYKARFSESRWQEWKEDIAWFKSKVHTARWHAILRDKGYNATPVWSMLVGGLLSNQIDTDNEWGMFFLALLDPILLCLAFLGVVWAFGPRTALFLVVFLGTSYMSHFSHMKGAYLRTDFAVALVLAVCFLRKEWYAAAGVAAAWAFLSRVFPAVFLFGLGAKLLWDFFPVFRAGGRAARARLGPNLPGVLFFLAALHVVWFILLAYGPPFIEIAPSRTWTLGVGSALLILYGLCVFLPAALWGVRHGHMNTGHFRFFAAFGTTIALLVVASLFYWEGTALWREFIAKISYHNENISPWRVGFKYLYVAHWRDTFAFDLPFREWTPVLHSATYRLNPVFTRSIMLFVLIFCFFAVRHLRDWRAFAFGFPVCFFLTAPTYYYYIMLLVPLLFLLPRIERPLHALGACIAFATAAIGYWFYGMWRQEYPTYYYLSWCVAGIVLVMMLIALWHHRTWRYRIAATALTLLGAAPFVYFYLYQMYPNYAFSNPRAWLLAPIIPLYALLLAALEYLLPPKLGKGRI